MTRDEQTASVLQNLRILVQAIQAYSKWVEKQVGISATQLWVMDELAVNTEMRISGVAKALSIHQSTSSNLLDKLERKGLVARKRGGPDQRVVRVYLTEQGSALLARVPRPAHGPVTEALHQLPDQILTSLAENMEELVACLPVRDKQAGMKPMSGV
ncbi:MAG: MarR family winged helix-turn-helix transcriptional regulator [Deltaproteobacteria bacterium]|jgi:DNA-binding MarR family transcriptional regulator